MHLSNCAKKFQAIADLCLNDNFPTLVLDLFRVSLKLNLSLILRKLGHFFMLGATCSGKIP